MNDTNETGTLKIGEYHPAANSAMKYIRAQISHPDFLRIKAAIQAFALSGNRLAEICLSTLERIEKKQPVSDRYLLGLAWVLKECEECEEIE